MKGCAGAHEAIQLSKAPDDRTKARRCTLEKLTTRTGHQDASKESTVRRRRCQTHVASRPVCDSGRTREGSKANASSFAMDRRLLARCEVAPAPSPRCPDVTKFSEERLSLFVLRQRGEVAPHAAAAGQIDCEYRPSLSIRVIGAVEQLNSPHTIARLVRGRGTRIRYVRRPPVLRRRDHGQLTE
jgi:hypothetical protein